MIRTMAVKHTIVVELEYDEDKKAWLVTGLANPPFEEGEYMTEEQARGFPIVWEDEEEEDDQDGESIVIATIADVINKIAGEELANKPAEPPVFVFGDDDGNIYDPMDMADGDPELESMVQATNDILKQFMQPQQPQEEEEDDGE